MDQNSSLESLIHDPVAAFAWWLGTAWKALDPEQRLSASKLVADAVVAEPALWWDAWAGFAEHGLNGYAGEQLAAAVLVPLLTQVPSFTTAIEDGARQSPAILLGLFVARMDTAKDSKSYEEAETFGLKQLPRDAAIAAFQRRLEYGLWPENIWTIGLVGTAASVDPDFVWTFLLDLLAAISDPAVCMFGCGDLEDFCWAASDRFIDRMEDTARNDARFRSALGCVWPGGETISPETYARIRSAAGRQ
jgi:hypothetical protein